MEGLDAAGHPGVPGHRCQQGPAHLHDGQGPRVLVPVPDGLWTFVLHLEDRGHWPGQILPGHLPAELPHSCPLPDDEQAVSVLQLHTAGVVLVYSGKCFLNIVLEYFTSL